MTGLVTRGHPAFHAVMTETTMFTLITTRSGRRGAAPLLPLVQLQHVRSRQLEHIYNNPHTVPSSSRPRRRGVGATVVEVEVEAEAVKVVELAVEGAGAILHREGARNHRGSADDREGKTLVPLIQKKKTLVPSSARSSLSYAEEGDDVDRRRASPSEHTGAERFTIGAHHERWRRHVRRRAAALESGSVGEGKRRTDERWHVRYECAPRAAADLRLVTFSKGRLED